MPVTRLTLTDFRSYAEADVRLEANAVVVTGDNGQGKTNLLDAVSLLSPGRGLRGVALSDAARSDGTGGWTVAAEVMAPGGAVAIGTGVVPAAPDRRIVRINGAPARGAALGEWLSVLWLTPAMDRLFVDTASARRRFLDRLVLTLDPAHGGEVTRYDAAMRARTRLLTGEAAADPAWLAGLERAMAEHGARVAAARVATVAALADALAAAPDGDFPQAESRSPARLSPISLRCWRATAASTPPPGAPPPGRTAPTSSSPMPPSGSRRRAVRPASRRRSSLASSSPTPSWWRRGPAGRRSCSSTRSPPISTPPPCRAVGPAGAGRGRSG